MHKITSPIYYQIHVRRVRDLVILHGNLYTHASFGIKSSTMLLKITYNDFQTKNNQTKNKQLCL